MRASSFGVAAGTTVMALSVAGPASGQEATPTESMEEVVVTGSRIQNRDYEATSPVVTIAADAFELSGEVQIETVLNSLPQLVPSITTTSNNPSNGGQANIDLRGLSGALSRRERWCWSTVLVSRPRTPRRRRPQHRAHGAHRWRGDPHRRLVVDVRLGRHRRRREHAAEARTSKASRSPRSTMSPSKATAAPR